MLRGTMTNQDGTIIYCTCEHHKVRVPTKKEHLEHKVEWDSLWMKDADIDTKAKLQNVNICAVKHLYHFGIESSITNEVLGLSFLVILDDNYRNVDGLVILHTMRRYSWFDHYKLLSSQ